MNPYDQKIAEMGTILHKIFPTIYRTGEEGEAAFREQMNRDMNAHVAAVAQDWADAGHPDPEEAAAEAEAQEPSAREALEEIEAARSAT